MRARVAHFGPWFFGGLYVVALALFLGVTVYVFTQQGHVNRELCDSTVANRRADRVQWITLRDLIVPTIETEAGKARFVALIDGVLAPIPPLACRGSKPVVAPR